ncbi:MAG: DUF1566 domain-containing protein [Acidobacteria bacterium]|nr:DUF1566 domain-containing protein [Acidobacteriota bacterium]
MRSKTLFVVVIGLIIGLLLAAAGVVRAGELEPVAGPADPGSRMYTLEQIYQRLTTGYYFVKLSGFTEPTSGPGSTMHTLDEIMAKAQPRALAKRVAKTGQTTCYDEAGNVIACSGTGQDGEYRAGIDPAVVPTMSGGGYNTPAWTGVRFTDNGDGTVTDNLTALIWLKDASCLGTQTWTAALSSAKTLHSGECNLSDGSAEGDWRLPNANELHSLGPGWPPGPPFTGVPAFAWTSTTYTDVPTYAWYVRLSDGVLTPVAGLKTVSSSVWPVRGGL